MRSHSGPQGMAVILFTAPMGCAGVEEYPTDCAWYRNELSLDAVSISTNSTSLEEAEAARWADDGLLEAHLWGTATRGAYVSTFQEADLFFVTQEDHDGNEAYGESNLQSPFGRAAARASASDDDCHPAGSYPPAPESYLISESWTRDEEGRTDDLILDPPWGDMILNYDGASSLVITYTNESDIDVTVTYTVLPTE